MMLSLPNISALSTLRITKMERVTGPGWFRVTVGMYASSGPSARVPISVTMYPLVFLFEMITENPSLRYWSPLAKDHGTFLKDWVTLERVLLNSNELASLRWL